MCLGIGAGIGAGMGTGAGAGVGIDDGAVPACDLAECADSCTTPESDAGMGAGVVVGGEGGFDRIFLTGDLTELFEWDNDSTSCLRTVVSWLSLFLAASLALVKLFKF